MAYDSKGGKTPGTGNNKESADPADRYRAKDPFSNKKVVEEEVKPLSKAELRQQEEDAHRAGLIAEAKRLQDAQKAREEEQEEMLAAQRKAEARRAQLEWEHKQFEDKKQREKEMYEARQRENQKFMERKKQEQAQWEAEQRRQKLAQQQKQRQMEAQRQEKARVDAFFEDTSSGSGRIA